MLERFLPSIRNRAAWGALSDRARIESGEELSVSHYDLMVRRLIAYRDEFQKIIVISPKLFMNQTPTSPF